MSGCKGGMRHGVSFIKLLHLNIMNNTYPCIQVNDIETSISWYSDFLGYQCTYKNAIKYPEYALIENKEQKIYLVKNESREAYASNIMLVEVSDIESEYHTLVDRGVIFYQEPGEGFFSKNEFIIKDYEDNKLIYKQKT